MDGQVRLACGCDDQGAGIPKTELKQIFKRFYRVPGPLATRVKGTGLGLYIVRSVAKRHGGRAWAESEGPGRGSTFVLQLPIAKRRNEPAFWWWKTSSTWPKGCASTWKPKAIRCRWSRPAKPRSNCSRRESPAFDRGGSRRDAAGQGRLRGDVRDARGRAVRPDADADRARPSRRRAARASPPGADDYLTKPFELSILIARIRGLLRRREWLRAAAVAPTDSPSDAAESNTSSCSATNRCDFDLLELHVRDQVFPLTLMEANVLRYLIEHEGKRVSRKTMLEEVWGLHEDTDTRAIDNFIVRLRRYIEDDPDAAAPSADGARRGIPVRGLARGMSALPNGTES